MILHAHESFPGKHLLARVFGRGKLSAVPLSSNLASAYFLNSSRVDAEAP